MIATTTLVARAGNGSDGYGGWRLGLPTANANAAGTAKIGTWLHVPSASLAA